MRPYEDVIPNSIICLIYLSCSQHKLRTQLWGNGDQKLGLVYYNNPRHNKAGKIEDSNHFGQRKGLHLNTASIHRIQTMFLGSDIHPPTHTHTHTQSFNYACAKNSLNVIGLKPEIFRTKDQCLTRRQTGPQEISYTTQINKLLHTECMLPLLFWILQLNDTAHEHTVESAASPAAVDSSSCCTARVCLSVTSCSTLHCSGSATPAHNTEIMS
jgi:hypothetical protein